MAKGVQVQGMCFSNRFNEFPLQYIFLFVLSCLFDGLFVGLSLCCDSPANSKQLGEGSLFLGFSKVSLLFHAFFVCEEINFLPLNWAHTIQLHHEITNCMFYSACLSSYDN